MADYNTMMIATGNEDAEELAYYRAMQATINDGSIWKMEGSAGRSAMNALSSGRCMLGRVCVRDYYGNRIPSRTEVKKGTKGSRWLVKETMGESWARSMSRVK